MGAGAGVVADQRACPGHVSRSQRGLSARAGVKLLREGGRIGLLACWHGVCRPAWWPRPMWLLMHWVGCLELLLSLLLSPQTENEKEKA